jgi:hypothetical protein
LIQELHEALVTFTMENAHAFEHAARIDGDRPEFTHLLSLFIRTSRVKGRERHGNGLLDVDGGPVTDRLRDSICELAKDPHGAKAWKEHEKVRSVSQLYQAKDRMKDLEKKVREITSRRDCFRSCRTVGEPTNWREWLDDGISRSGDGRERRYVN